MAHHGTSPEALDEFFNRGRRAQAAVDRELETLREKLGPTGRFPEGKIVSDDEGEIRIAIGQKDGNVVMEFGKPIAWVGLTAEQAESVGQLLLDHGREARLRRG